MVGGTVLNTNTSQPTFASERQPLCSRAVLAVLLAVGHSSKALSAKHLHSSLMGCTPTCGRKETNTELLLLLLLPDSEL
jgi:hypothetical protein